jgi:hypothetical protein
LALDAPQLLRAPPIAPQALGCDKLLLAHVARSVCVRPVGAREALQQRRSPLMAQITCLNIARRGHWRQLLVIPVLLM